MRSSIQKREPQWLHCSFRHLSTCRSICRSTKGYHKFCRAMCCLAWSWFSMHATRCRLTCRATSIISQAWWARFISTARTLACYSTFANNCWVVLVIHRVSSCWAPLHVALSRATTTRRSLWRSRIVARLFSSFTYLRGTLGLHLQFFQSEAKWSQALKTQ
jgi:hypothetical protein